MKLHNLRLLGLSALACMPLAAVATEGGIGRPITGQQVTSNAGIVPPTPGLVLTLASIYFTGDMGASRPVSLGRTFAVGVKATASYNVANLTYVWDTGPGRWNFASGIALPFQYTKAEIGLAGNRVSRSTSESNTQFADVLINPIVASYHITETDHLALSLPIYAPTGAYNADRLANAGQNTWTVSPTIAYTKLLGKGSEFSALAAFDFYTRNKDTDYKNGAVFRVDAMWTTNIAPQWHLGVVGGWIQQLQKDSGPTADRLNGFKGYSVGFGPILTWSGKIGNQPAAFTARWVADIDTKNRPKGNGVALNLTLPFF
ncbi:SphA family protein [Variovorax sp. GB1R11]|uniref:SphA family protein n=1 Tax=Variovorax sp. GB1R11 TaxID=3443741 RepID=UPI003F4466E3